VFNIACELFTLSTHGMGHLLRLDPEVSETGGQGLVLLRVQQRLLRRFASQQAKIVPGLVARQIGERLPCDFGT
jgi:hypothetical protein